VEPSCSYECGPVVSGDSFLELSGAFRDRLHMFSASPQGGDELFGKLPGVLDD
jgi:hypothetical protein